MRSTELVILYTFALFTPHIYSRKNPNKGRWNIHWFIVIGRTFSDNMIIIFTNWLWGDPSLCISLLDEIASTTVETQKPANLVWWWFELLYADDNISRPPCSVERNVCQMVINVSLFPFTIVWENLTLYILILEEVANAIIQVDCPIHLVRRCVKLVHTGRLFSLPFWSTKQICLSFLTFVLST